MYVFCRTECEFSYLVLFNILETVGRMLFGIDIDLETTHGGMDRTPYIANAYLEAWPRIVLMMCWPHLIRKFKEADLKKALKLPENWAAIEKAIVQLHMCRSSQQHLWLGPIVFAFWADVLQEPAFATLFERTYFVDGRGNTYWSHWTVGAAGEDGGIDANQNGIESGHETQKVVLKKLLRVPTIMFLEQSMPLILAAGNRKIKDLLEQTALPRYRGEGPVEPHQIVMKAMFLMEIDPWYIEVDHPDENSRSFVVTANSDKMTAARKSAFTATLVGKEPPRMPKVTSQAKLDELFATTHGCHIVNAHKVTDRTFQNSFISKSRVTIGDDATPVEEDMYKLVNITCSCGMYKHTSNYCMEVIAVAAELGLIDMEMLLTEMAPRNGVGAPKVRVNGGEDERDERDVRDERDARDAPQRTTNPLTHTKVAMLRVAGALALGTVPTTTPTTSH